MPVIRATTTAAEAIPCCADGTTRKLAEVSGAITRPSPMPATARSVCSAGTERPKMSWCSVNRLIDHFEISQ